MEVNRPMTFDKLKALVETRRGEMVSHVLALGAIPGVNPRMGGTGEYQRVLWLTKLLDEHQIPYTLFEAEDGAVPEGKRVSVTVLFPPTQERDKTLWFMAHLDTVAPGDPAGWSTDPFTPTIKDGRIYGLGVEDNGQAVVCLLQTILLLQSLKPAPRCGIGFVFASDEETGSQYGLHAMVEQGLFHPRDEAVVPDAGSADGSFVEVAEKSQVWLEFTVLGKQAHGSMPHLGINAGSVGARLAVELEDTLRTRYAWKDDLFDPPYSTFEYTQKHANVESPNVLPGRDVFAMDLRILPRFPVDEVLETVTRIVSQYEYRYRVRISCRVTQRADASLTAPEAQIAKTLIGTLEEAGVHGRCGGIGGGTCGAILRHAGIPAVVWSTLDELAHQPNEYTIIDNLVQDTAVFLAVIQDYCSQEL